MDSEKGVAKSVIPLYSNLFPKSILGKSFISASGTINDLKYEINLYPVDGKDHSEVLKLIQDVILKNYAVELQEMLFSMLPPNNNSDYVWPMNGILVVDIDAISIHGSEQNIITNASLFALQLCSSFGILYHTKYIVPDTRHDIEMSATISGSFSWSPSQGVIPILTDHQKMYQFQIGVKLLDIEKFKPLVEFLVDLDLKKEDDRVNFHKIAYLIKSYFFTILCLTNYEHKFLLLVVILESMFKFSERNLSPAAIRLSKFVADTKDQQKVINNQIFGEMPNTYARIRNDIAHGDNSMNVDKLKSKYAELHELMRKAIITYFLDFGAITHTRDYSSELDHFINNRYTSLSNS